MEKGGGAYLEACSESAKEVLEARERGEISEREFGEFLKGEMAKDAASLPEGSRGRP